MRIDRPGFRSGNASCAGRAGWFLLAAALLLAPLLAAIPRAFAGADYPEGSRIEWNTFDSALFTRARTENRPLFLYFHGQWCTWCRDFQDESLEHDDVAKTIQDGYIPVLIDLDRRRDLFTRYGGRGLPFVVIVDALDNVQGRFTGHVGPADLHQVLLERRRSISVTGRELSPADDPIDNPEAFLRMLDEVYDADTRRLSGSAMFGTLSKRPQPWTMAFLLQQESWSERMPGLLDQIVEDLWDSEEGGFFFFHDPDQPDRERALETSKRLDQNAAFLWLFADAYHRFGDESHRKVIERNLDHIRTNFWNPDQQRFYSSQYSDDTYYSQPLGVRRTMASPAIDRTTYADASGQIIAGLVRAGQALNDPSLLEWAKAALEGLEKHLFAEDAYLHALPEDGPAELPGYLPAQIWPGIAWHLYQTATDTRDPRREQALLETVKTFHDPDLDAYRERRSDEFEPWVEPRTQAALAWWLAQLPAAEVERTGIDPALVHAQLIIAPGADPDDIALGMWALDQH